MLLIKQVKVNNEYLDKNIFNKTKTYSVMLPGGVWWLMMGKSLYSENTDINGLSKHWIETSY
jgi:hypothetical protein